MESVNQMSEYVNKGLDFVNKNKILSSVLGMLLVLYAAAAAPKLPKAVVKIFDNSLFKLGFMFMIAYLATKDPSVAIITAVALLVTIQTLASREAADAAVSAVQATQAESQARTQSELVKVAQERIDARQEAVSEIKVVNEGNNAVAVKESFAENEEIRIPLSPSRAEFIEECTRRADAHYGAAAKAEAEGNTALAEAHKQEAAKQEIKIEAVVSAKEHIMAANDAEASGHAELAEAHMQEATKQEAKAEAIVKSEAHAAAAEEALSRGALAEAEAHKQAAVAEEAKALSMVRAEVQPERVTVETEISGIPVPHSEVEHAPVLAEPESSVEEVVRATCGAPFDVEGYSGNVYASI